MGLFDLLACPDCRAPVVREADGVRCTGCPRVYAIDRGVPVMMLEGPPPAPDHDHELTVWDDYSDVIMHMFASLAPDQVILDIGAGHRKIDEPRLVRMDVFWTPHVDVIGDAHSLPFRDEVLDVVMASAVMEHLRDPFGAAREMHRILAPGGQVLADCNFVFPFHGFPSMYFCLTEDGMREVFACFREVAVEVAPWQMPTYALQALVLELLKHFEPQTQLDHEFLTALRGLGRFQVDEVAQNLSQESARRMAAGLTYLGLKQSSRDETTVPAPVLEAYRASPELQQRYPDPHVLVPSILEPAFETLMGWALREGRASVPSIAGHFDAVEPFRR